MSTKKQSIQISFILFLVVLTFISIALTVEAKDGLKERIKKAKTFDDIFILEKSIKLESTKDSYISRLNAMAINSNGDLIINNNGSSGAGVLIFNKNGKFVKEIGRKGSGPGEYANPLSLCMNKAGDIFVTDVNNRRIIVYGRDYKFKKNIFYTSNNQHIHINSRNDILLYMGMNLPFKRKYNCIAKLSSAGKTIKEFAELPNEVMGVKFYANFDCMALDKNDFIYETNPLMPHFRKYDSNGKLVKEFGDKIVKMIPEKGKDGVTREYPRIILSFSICKDVIMVMYDNNKMDCYDLEGNVLNKNIIIDKRIVFTADNQVYLISNEDGQDNPILHKYVVKQ